MCSSIHLCIPTPKVPRHSNFNDDCDMLRFCKLLSVLGVSSGGPAVAIGIFQLRKKQVALGKIQMWKPVVSWVGFINHWMTSLADAVWVQSRQRNVLKVLTLSGPWSWRWEQSFLRCAKSCFWLLENWLNICFLMHLFRGERLKKQDQQFVLEKEELGQQVSTRILNTVDRPVWVLMYDHLW